LNDCVKLFYGSIHLCDKPLLKLVSRYRRV
jgi:hypothetical protein